MRKLSLLGAALLVVLVGLGAFAQDPKININVPPGFAADKRGCIEITEPGTVWAITGGAWARAEVKNYLIAQNPFLAERERQFDWRGNGPNSGIKVFEGELICGFTTTTVDADLELSSLKTSDISDLRNERDVAKARLNLLFWTVLALAGAAVGYHIVRIRNEARRHNHELERIATAMWHQRQDLEAANQTAIAAAAARLVETQRRHAQQLAEQIAATHALYQPALGVHVVQGGLRPTQGGEIELAMLHATYATLPISQYLPLEGATAARLFYRTGPIEFGLMDGHVVVRSGDNRLNNKILVNQPGYRTTIRIPDGREITVYSLEACCNPVLTGTWMEGAADDFTFTPMEVGSLVMPPPAPIVADNETPIMEIVTPNGGRVLLFGPESPAVQADATSLVLTMTLAKTTEDEMVDVGNPKA